MTGVMFQKIFVKDESGQPIAAVIPALYSKLIRNKFIWARPLKPAPTCENEISSAAQMCARLSGAPYNPRVTAMDSSTVGC